MQRWTWSLARGPVLAEPGAGDVLGKHGPNGELRERKFAVVEHAGLASRKGEQADGHFRKTWFAAETTAFRPNNVLLAMWMQENHQCPERLASCRRIPRARMRAVGELG